MGVYPKPFLDIMEPTVTAYIGEVESRRGVLGAARDSEVEFYKSQGINLISWIEAEQTSPIVERNLSPEQSRQGGEQDPVTALGEVNEYYATP